MLRKLPVIKNKQTNDHRFTMAITVGLSENQLQRPNSFCRAVQKKQLAVLIYNEYKHTPAARILLEDVCVPGPRGSDDAKAAEDSAWVKGVV